MASGRRRGSQDREFVRDGLLAGDTDYLVSHLAAAEIQQCWNALDVEPRGERRVFIDVHFRNNRTAMLLLCDFFERWREHLARPAPVGPKIHYHGL